MSKALDELKVRLLEYQSISQLARDAADRAERDPHAAFVQKLALPTLGEKTADRRAAIRNYFDSLQQTLFEQSFVGMVATFERWAFIHLGNAMGEARKVVGASYGASLAYARAAERLVREESDIGDLASVEKFVACYPGQLAGTLQELRLHRNWIAHGKRVGRASRFSQMEDVYKALCDVVRAIEGS